MQLAIRLRSSVSRLNQNLLSVRREGDGPSLSGLGVMLRIHRLGETSPGALARQIGVRPQSLTRLLAELEAQSWIVRDVSRVDRRRNVLRLNAQGVQVLRAEAQRREGALGAAAAAVLDASEMARLLEACELLDRIGLALTKQQAASDALPRH